MTIKKPFRGIRRLEASTQPISSMTIKPMRQKPKTPKNKQEVSNNKIDQLENLMLLTQYMQTNQLVAIKLNYCLDKMTQQFT